MQPDYLWHDGCLAGELCRASYSSRLAWEVKDVVLRGALARRAMSTNEFAVPRGAAPTAAWYFMRLRLERHRLRATPLDPTELSDAERNAIEGLHETQGNWLSLGSNYPGIFGIREFVMMAPHLIEPRSKLMLPVAAWPSERQITTVFSWVLRPLSLDTNSIERQKAFEHVAARLFETLGAERLVGVLAEVARLDHFPSAELATALRRAIVAAEYGETPDESTTDTDLARKLESLVPPELAQAIDELTPLKHRG